MLTSPGHVLEPVAMTVIFTSSFIFSSSTAPKMMLASSWAALWMMVEASFTSASRSELEPGNVDEDAARTVDGARFEQRRRDSRLGG